MADLDGELLSLASAVVVEAGRIAKESGPASREPIMTKSSRTDFVTAVDRTIEAQVTSRILAARPNDSILGEEGSGVNGASGVRWIIDPIDGTVNFSYGMPGFCTSIAAELDGRVVVGVVYDPLRSELFSARRGGGAYLNGVSIRRGTTVVPLENAVVGTGFDYRAERRREQAIELVRILPAIGDIRRIGSAALELCWVACSRLDAYYESGTRHWDRAAGGLIATEAGAEVILLSHGSSDDEPTVVAAGPGMLESLVALVSGER